LASSGHALETNDRLHEILADERFALVIGGHTHRRMVRRFARRRGPSVTIVNAGTLCADAEPCALVLDLERREVEVHDVLPNLTTACTDVISIG
jgi:predicted phosphodiesterase